jgi:dTDP-4-dehydrorhamnose reductase
MLGRELAGVLNELSLPFDGTDREIDFTRREVLGDFVRGKTIDWIVNCAAYTAVDKAEDDQTSCRALNAAGPENLGRVASQIGARVLHVSTDYVFDGQAEQPYTEDAAVNPQTVYGRTKAEGEVLLAAACPRSVILRTAWLYGLHGPNFVTTMLRLMKERDSIGVVADQYGAPTWASDLARVMASILTKPPLEGGIFHASGEGLTTWHGFATAIAEDARTAGLLEATKRVEVRALTTSEYPTKASRPHWSVLSKAKLKSELGLSFPSWRESLKAYLETLSRLDKGTKQA